MNKMETNEELNDILPIPQEELDEETLSELRDDMNHGTLGG
mgnify:CR=1 FL=1